MNTFWWVIIGIFIVSSAYVFYWIYRFYRVLRELIGAICELYYTFEKFKSNN
jgi:hypothetical protein